MHRLRLSVAREVVDASIRRGSSSQRFQSLNRRNPLAINLAHASTTVSCHLPGADRVRQGGMLRWIEVRALEHDQASYLMVPS